MLPGRCGDKMRRSRFVKPMQPRENEKASIREALWFDLRSPETSDDATLSDWRVAGLDHVAVLLGITHLLITATCVALSPTLVFDSLFDNPLIPSCLVIALDIAVAVALFTRDRFNLAPHTIVRSACVYLALSGVLWTWFGYAVADDAYIMPLAAAPIAMTAGI